MTERTYDLEERLLSFAADVIRLTDTFPRSSAGRHVADQLLRSGTSPLSNHGEAQAAESRDDFIHKMSICLKELRESMRWLRLVNRVPLVKVRPKRIGCLPKARNWCAFSSRASRQREKTARETFNVERRTLNAERGCQRSKFRVQRSTFFGGSHGSQPLD